jgi:hypothetical protein
MKVHWLVQAAAATIVVTVLQAAFSFLVPASGAGTPGLGGVLASNALTALVLAWLNSRLAGTRVTRALTLWLIWGGIQACALVEAVLFDIRIPKGDLPWLYAHALAVSAGVAAFLGLAFRPAEARHAAPRPAWPSWWRVALCDAAYIALYLAAGMLVYPFIREFYEASPMPSMAAVVATQVGRGLVLSGIVLLIVRRLVATRRAAAAAAAAALGILGGVAPLLIANPYLPDAIRYAHLPEVGVSNVLFGLLAGWLLSPPATGAAGAERALAPAAPIG